MQAGRRVQRLSHKKALVSTGGTGCADRDRLLFSGSRNETATKDGSRLQLRVGCDTLRKLQKKQWGFRWPIWSTPRANDTKVESTKFGSRVRRVD